jgi:hypothetical protein
MSMGFGRSAAPGSAAGRYGRVGARGRGVYWICIPEIARAITSRWISEVPSKIV